MFNAINKHINTKVSSYGHSNDNFIPIDNLKIIDCSLGTNPFSYLNHIHHKINFGDIIDTYHYPTQKEYNILKETIIRYYNNINIKKENIHLGHGGIILLERLATKFFGPSHIIGIGPQFPHFINDHKKIGGTYSSINLIKEDGSFDYNLSDLKEKLLKESADICYIDNPNNPTGFYFGRDIIEEIIGICHKKNIVCIIDEAYGSFIKSEDSSIHLIKKYNNLIVLRSFSKGFGLSGARAAYIICGNELSQLYNKINNGFEPSAMSIKMCVEAGNHGDFMQECREKVKSIKTNFFPLLEGLGYKVLPNHENVSIFLMQKKGIDLHKFLQNKNILTSPGIGYSSTTNIIDNSYVRVLVPTDIEMMNEFITRIS